MNILAIGAHADDVEIGCGGTLAKYSKLGNRIVIFTASSKGFNPYGEKIRDLKEIMDNGKKSAEILGAELIVGDFTIAQIEYNDNLNSELIRIIKEYNIEMVLTHWTGDAHHDHSNLAKASIYAARHLNRILMYQSNWYQSDTAFYSNFFVDISDFQEKKEQLMNCYLSEMEKRNGYWIEYQRNLARNYGLKIGTEYAEGFQCVKWVI